MQLPGPNTNKRDSARYPLLQVDEKFGLFELLSIRARACFLDALATGSLSMAVATIAAAAIVLGPYGQDVEHNALLSCGAFAFGIGFFDCLCSFGPIILVAAIGWWFFDLHASANHMWYLPGVIVAITAGASAFAVNAIYHVIFESSKLSATPGKSMIGLKVWGADGRPLSLLRASFRHALKQINLAAILCPVLLLWKCNRRQLAHDCLTRSYVLPAVEVKTEAEVIAMSDRETVSPAQVAWGHSREEAKSIAANLPPVDSNVEYPSLLRRALASVLDGILFYFIESAVCVTLAAVVSNWLSPYGGIIDWQTLNYIITLSVVVVSLTVPITMLVFAAFESSRLAATPGKIALGLKVTSLKGRKLTFWPAMVKQVVQGLTYMSLCPLFFLIFLGVTAAKVGNTGRIAGLCFVLFYLVYGALLCVTVAGARQTFIDKLSHRFVIKESTNTELKRIIT